MATERDDPFDIDDEVDDFTKRQREEEATYARADAGDDATIPDGIVDDDVPESLQSIRKVMAYGEDAEAQQRERDQFNASIDAILESDPNTTDEPEEFPEYAAAAVKVAGFSQAEMDGFMNDLSRANEDLRASYAPPQADVVEAETPLDVNTLDSEDFAVYVRAIQRGSVDPRDLPKGMSYDVFTRKLAAATEVSES